MTDDKTTMATLTAPLRTGASSMTHAEATYLAAIKALNAAAYAALRAAKDTEALPMVNRQRLREIANMTDKQVDEGAGE